MRLRVKKKMSRRCELTGVGPMVGHNVSHSNVKTKRRFLPALVPASLQSESPYSPVETPVGLRKATFGLACAHVYARRAASNACAAKSPSNGL